MSSAARLGSDHVSITPRLVQLWAGSVPLVVDDADDGSEGEDDD